VCVCGMRPVVCISVRVLRRPRDMHRSVAHFDTHTGTHMQTGMRTHTHTVHYTHAHARKHSHACTYARSLARTRACMRTDMSSSCTRLRLTTQLPSSSHTHTHTHRRTPQGTHARAHIPVDVGGLHDAEYQGRDQHLKRHCFCWPCPALLTAALLREGEGARRPMGRNILILSTATGCDDAPPARPRCRAGAGSNRPCEVVETVPTHLHADPRRGGELTRTGHHCRHTSSGSRTNQNNFPAWRGVASIFSCQVE